jgi:hypothetical protein
MDNIAFLPNLAILKRFAASFAMISSILRLAPAPALVGQPASIRGTVAWNQNIASKRHLDPSAIPSPVASGPAYR